MPNFPQIATVASNGELQFVFWFTKNFFFSDRDGSVLRLYDSTMCIV